MNFLDIAKSRYATKLYDKGKKVSEEDINQLKEILRLSPSSINSQPWKFIFISDEKAKDRLAEASMSNEQKIKEASCLIVFCVIDNIEKFESIIKKNLPDAAVSYYNNNIKTKSEEEIKSWFARQVYISLGFFLSACAVMEIDATPMEGIQNEEYDKILNLKGYKSLCAAVVGYRDANDNFQPARMPKSRLSSDIVIDTF